MADTAATPAFYTPAQVRALLHCSESTVRQYMRDGTLKAYRVGGSGTSRHVRIAREDVMRLLHPITPTRPLKPGFIADFERTEGLTAE